MTSATVASSELAEKGADIDVLRQMVQFAVANGMFGAPSGVGGDERR